MNAKPYPKYKASGVEWLGKVPEHWEVVPFKQFVDIQNGSDHKHLEQDEGYPVLGSGGAFAYASDFLYDGESVLLGRKGTIDKPLHVTGRFWTVDTMYWTKIRSNASGRFAYYTALSIPFGYYSTNTALPSMTKGTLRSHRVLRPSINEQQAIAAFLDERTAKLDGLLEKKRALIGKLREKRSALISRTVTKGLPPEAAAQAGLTPNPKLKPSGIEWLGDIPEHWDVSTVRRKARRVQTGGTPPTAEERFYEEGTVPWYGPSSFNDDITVSQPVKFLNQSAVTERAARMFSAGATMIITIGATIGKVTSLEEPGSCNQQITVIEFDGRWVHPPFATYQLKRLEPALRAIAPSATLPILDQGEIGDLPFAIPSLEEQVATVDYLKIETSKIDRMIQKVDTAIEKLTEYRTALITAAVTGKIDVRDCRKP